MLEGSRFPQEFYGQLPQGIIGGMYGPEYGDHLPWWKRDNAIGFLGFFGLGSPVMHGCGLCTKKQNYKYENIFISLFLIRNIAVPYYQVRL
jgi:hypothetical protein